MVGSLSLRKRAELQAKIEALPRELKTWCDLTAAGGPFEKHHTQVVHLSEQIEGLNDEVRSQLDALKTSDELLRQARAIEARLLAVHSVWDYFRSKLVLRSLEPFESVLKMADAYAWACYEPIRSESIKAGATVGREPPLVALQADSSPSALPRDHAYEVVRPPGGWIDRSSFAAVIGALPVPIIGLPWYALEHLPHAPLLAHEVGHVVASDFRLGELVAKALAAASIPPANRPAWDAWLSEVFADVFACVAAGPSFVWALIDVLAAPADRVASERKTISGGWGKYPTSTVRIRINTEALRQLGFAKEQEGLDAEWLEAYPPASGVTETFGSDVPAVVRAILEADVFPRELKFESITDQARSAYLSIRQGLPIADAVVDSRAVIAAAAELYRTRPDDGSHVDLWNRLRTRIVTFRPPGQLARPIPRSTDLGRERDRAAGRSLAARLFQNLRD